MNNQMSHHQIDPLEQADRDTRAFVEAELEKQKVYVEHGVEGVRKMQVLIIADADNCVLRSWKASNILT